MSRKLSNWLDSYMEYTTDTESARIFHRWVGISAISSALMKKVHLALGRIKVHPNTYVVLVSEPGIARKSQAIAFGEDIVSKIQAIKTTPDAITKEALIQELEQSKQVEVFADGTLFAHCSVSIVSKEFESFLGQKKENTKLIVLLTDLFDAREGTWTYKTKGGGTNTIISPYLTILGATTPDSLASSLPPQAIGGGLTSRIMFVWAAKREKKVAKPSFTEELLQLREHLVYDLDHIQKLAGTFQFSQAADDFWLRWYEEFDEQSPSRICPSQLFLGWYSRKPTYILKLSQIHAAAESDDLIIEPHHIRRAISDIEETEHTMNKAFAGIGRSPIALDVASFVGLVATHTTITEQAALKILYRDMDADKFKNVVNTSIRAGFVTITIDPKTRVNVFTITTKGRSIL